MHYLADFCKRAECTIVANKIAVQHLTELVCLADARNGGVPTTIVLSWNISNTFDAGLFHHLTLVQHY